MKVVIFGATGMVGRGALLECLDDSRVQSVLVVVRRSTGASHPKLTELLLHDFFDYSGIEERFADCDACFFCLGVSAAGKTEAAYHHLTYDLTLAAAQAMARAAPRRLTFCYVSGAGTDASEHGRVMWARVKGKTENALFRLPFKDAYMFRPGFIEPLRGVRSSTAVYQIPLTLLRPLFPVLRRLFPASVTTTVNVGQALIRVAAEGCPDKVLDPAAINGLAGRA